MRRITVALGFAQFVFAVALTTLPALAFEPKISVEVLSHPRPFVRGTTNMPDGTVFMIELRRREAMYSGQSKAVAAGGRFESEQFTAAGRDLPPGEYSVSVVMPLAQHQPAAAQALMGPRGAKMKGPLIANGPLGATAKLQTVVKLGGQPRPNADRRERARSKAASREAAARDCADIAELVNAAVRSGLVSGSQAHGEEKLRQIEACKASLNKH